MFLKKRTKNSIVSVSLNPLYVVCSLISLNTEPNSKKINVCAYKKVNLTSLEFEKSTIFNITKISNIISTFIKKNNITNPIISMSVSGPNIFEKIITVATSSPKISDFKITHLVNIKKMKLSQIYLCPSLKNGFKFYVCAIEHQHLFQYKLLAKKTNTKLELITTNRSSILELYKHINQKRFSKSQFAIDLEQNNFDINSMITDEIITQNCNIKKNVHINLQKDAQHIATSIGLFLLGNRTWKK